MRLLTIALIMSGLLAITACSSDQATQGNEPGYSVNTDEYRAFIESYEEYAGETKQNVLQEACNLFASVDYRTEIPGEELDDLIINWPELENFSSERYGRDDAITDARAFGFVLSGMNRDFNSEMLRDYCEVGLG